MQSPPISVTVDTVAPTVTINQASGQNDPTGAQPVNFSVVFGEAVTGFNASDISLAGSTANVSGALLNVIPTGSGNASFNVSVSNVTTGGSLIINFPANAAEDLAGNFNTSPTISDNSITLDLTPPSVTINQAASQIEPTNVMPVAFTVVFGEPVTGFDGSDVSLAGSTASIATATKTVTGSGTDYTVLIGGIISNGGFIRATILAQSSFDSAGNGNSPSTSTDNTVTVDNVSPTVTVNQASGQPDPTSILPVNYTIIFSEPVTGLDASDISLSNSTAVISGLTFTLTGSGTIYNLAVGGNFVSTAGLLRISIRTGAAVDVAGNQSPGSTSTDNTVTLLSKSGVGDYDGDGKFDPAVFRPSSATWFINRTTAGILITTFGANGDRPLPNSFIP